MQTPDKLVQKPDKLMYKVNIPEKYISDKFDQANVGFTSSPTHADIYKSAGWFVTPTTQMDDPHFYIEQEKVTMDERYGGWIDGAQSSANCKSV